MQFLQMEIREEAQLQFY